MKQLIWVLLLASLSIGCGKLKEEEDRERNPNAYTWSDPMRAAETIVGEEATIGLEICRSLKIKRQEVSTWVDGDREASFQMARRLCDASRPSDNGVLVAKVRHSRGQSLRFEPLSRSSDFVEDILSDKTEELEYICENLIDGGSPSNTIIDGRLSYQMSFFRENDKDYLQIAYFKTASDGRRMPYQIDIGEVYTSRTTPGEYARGFIKTRTVNRHCGNNKTQYWKQTLL